MKWLRRFALLLALWILAVAAWIASGPAENSSDRAQVALVLGAAVDDTKPSPVFAARLDHAIALYKAGRVHGLLLTGGRSAEDSLSESNAGKLYAVSKGVPEDAIFIEEVSRTTRQNLKEAQKVMEREAIASALIVSDPLHLRRAMLMTDEQAIDALPSAATGTRYRSWSTKLPFLLRETYFIHHFWLFGE